MTRKIVTLIITVVMLMTFIPASVFAEGEEPVKPVSATWEGQFPLQGVIGSDTLTNLNIPDLASFAVTYSDGSTKKFTYREVTREEGTDGEYIESGFYNAEEDEESELAYIGVEVESPEDAPVEFKEGVNKVQLRLNVPYVLSGKGTPDEEIDYEGILVDVDVECYKDYPVKVEFVPAEGFAPHCFIGINYLSPEDFYGEGNKFVVTRMGIEADSTEYTEYTQTFLYAKGTTIDGEEEEGFFRKGKVDLERFEFESDEFNLEKGANEVELLYTEYVEESDEEVEIPFKVTLDVEKYDAYAYSAIYAYTGKLIKPRFKVYNSEDELIPAEQYTYTVPKNKKMGWYDVEITFKDEFKNDFLNPTFTASYGIGPKAPVIKKLVPGKKKLTVKWSKLSKAALKNVDSYMIEVALDKNFSKGYKSVTVNKKGIKKYSKTITKLKKGKKYYVTITAFKKITQDGVKYEMPSEPSKVKAAKVK